MANGTMPQGGGGSVITAAPLRKRRAEGVGPPTADVPACGILLPAGTVPVLSFPGLFVKEKALTGVDAAVHALGGKTRAGPMVALVDAALLDLARTTRRQQDGASAAAASCDGVSCGGGGQAKKTKKGRRPNLPQPQADRADGWPSRSHEALEAGGAGAHLVRRCAVLPPTVALAGTRRRRPPVCDRPQCEPKEAAFCDG